MGLSYRMFLVDCGDRIYRLAAAKFDEMLRNPTKHHNPLFAGQRVRAAGVVVQLVGRKPQAILQMTFHMLAFDQSGRFDSEAFQRQESSRSEVALAPVLSALTAEVGVGVDASTRFTARGARWAPSKALMRAINEAALARVKCPRL